MRQHSRTAAAGVLAAALLFATAGPASAAAGPAAAPGCTETWDAWWVCRHYVDARVHAAPDRNSDVIGALSGDSSRFHCRTEGGWHGSGPHKTRWLEAEGGGWVSDGTIISETDPVALC
ncbi:hypothetical protein [Saccharothrix sp. HUAS TT1]|uniref:hypothetical protein n=1 Tax=unclassified Saccharothrix TaxID=2593673 RepID=UPI00345C10AD